MVDVGFGDWVAQQWRRFTAPRNLYSISDPGLASVFQIGAPNFSGVDINESSAMSLSAFYRAVSLVAGTIGTLPLRTLRMDPDTGLLTRQPSFLDTAPGGPDGATPMGWSETVVSHLMVHGNAYLRHIYGGAGQLIGLQPIHPLSVTIEFPMPGDDTYPVGGRWFIFRLVDGTQLRLDRQDLTHIMGLSLDGIYGMSVLSMARNGLGTAIAGDRAAATLFSSGALVSGMVSSEDDVTEDEAKVIKSSIERNVSGWENAGRIPFINRKLKFTPWQQTAQDAQFLQSRQFQIEEISRWTGVPPHLLMQTDKQTSWGTGVEEQNNGLARFTLNPWTVRIEQALSRLLPNTRWCEFDYTGLERPTPEDEIALIIQQVQAGILTIDEARALRNMAPLPAADQTPPPSEDPEAVAA